MIKLKRTRTEGAIPSQFRGANRLVWSYELLANQRAIKQALQVGQEINHSFDTGRWKGVKAQLFKESGDKCAYCEANTKVVAYGDVEHFRPKSIYWWLAYCYDNYVIACTICNQRYKSDHFPLLPGHRALIGPAVAHNSPDTFLEKWQSQLFPDPLNDAHGLPMAEFEKLHHQERPLLLHPYFDQPDNYYAWQAHDDLKEVWLIPKNEEAQPFVHAAETYYGLNRTELKNLRYQKYSFFRTYHRTLSSTGVSPALKQEIRDTITDMLSDGREFAGMLRYFHQQWQLTPP